jgi:predicted nucleic-acid-binding Zn-ribbon protein
MRRPSRPRLRPKAKAQPPPEQPADEYIRFTCSCGAALKIPAWRVDGHGKCPKCKRRLLLSGKIDAKGKGFILPLVLESADRSGQTFMIEPQYRIEDHFKEIEEPQDKIPFTCICSFRMNARPNMVDKRGKCPKCGARLLLVGKKNPRTHRLEIHPLVLEEDEKRSGDTQIVEG